jgi:hypothetical protein
MPWDRLAAVRLRVEVAFPLGDGKSKCRIFTGLLGSLDDGLLGWSH